MNLLAPAVLRDAPALLARDLDAVDEAVVNVLGGRCGAAAVSLRDLAGDASAVLSVSIIAVWAGRNPEQAEEALLGALAPRLVSQVVAVCGDAWRAEAEAVVDLVLASRLEELGSLPMAMRAGSMGVDLHEATDLLAPVVQHPQAVWLV
jgi:hypothetical protein